MVKDIVLNVLFAYGDAMVHIREVVREIMCYVPPIRYRF